MQTHLLALHNPCSGRTHSSIPKCLDSFRNNLGVTSDSTTISPRACWSRSLTPAGGGLVRDETYRPLLDDVYRADRANRIGHFPCPLFPSFQVQRS